MKKNFLQIWIMCPSKQHKMEFLLFEQRELTENSPFWGPWEIEIPDVLPESNEIPALLKKKNRITLIDPILIPFKKNYEKENSTQTVRELYLVYGIKLPTEKNLLFENEKTLPDTVRWIPLAQVLDYLHKEYHSIVFFDWYKAIKLNKLP